MDNSKERRYIDRLAVPQAKVYYRTLGRYAIFNYYQGPLDLADISKSALRIYGKLPGEKNTNVEIKLVIPGFSMVTVKCRIMGFDERHTYTIAQLLPYGIGRNYNSFQTKHNLELLMTHSGGDAVQLNMV